MQNIFISKEENSMKEQGPTLEQTANKYFKVIDDYVNGLDTSGEFHQLIGENSLEVVQKHSGEGECVGLEILLCYGGPTITLDTEKMELSVSHTSEKVIIRLSPSACLAIEKYFHV